MLNTTGSLRSGWRGAAFAARCRAASTHLLLSAAVAGGATLILAVVSYPAPFFYAAGGGVLVALLLGVDVVLGPLVTFFVFDRRKAELRRDLAIVVSLQLAALAYGLHAAALGRPVFLTFVVDRFEIVSAAEIDADELGRASAEFRSLSWTGPRLAAARRPESVQAREELLSAALAGLDLKHFLRYYAPYTSIRADVLAKARPVDELKILNDLTATNAALVAAGIGTEREAAVRWLPVSGKREDLVAIVDAADGAVLAVLRLTPWR